MAVEQLSSFEALQTLESDWMRLLERDPNATPFQSPHWLLPWWRHFGSGELLALATRDDGALTALAPLCVFRDEDDPEESLGMLMGTGVSDYLDMLLAPGALASEIVQCLAEANCAMWDLQQLRPESSLLNAPLPDGAGSEVEDQEPCLLLLIAGAGEELSNLLSTHARKKLRYYRRSLERTAPVTIETPDTSSLGEALTALFDLHAARWQQRGLPGVLADDVIQAFHREVAARMLSAGSLRMYVMRHGERIIAVFYGFAQHDTVYYYLSGYAPELEKLSPGTLIVAHAIEEAVRSGARTFDFLRGAEEYKYSWGATDRMNRRRRIARV